MKNSIVGFSFLLAVVLASVPSDVRASAGDLYSGQLSHNEIDKFTPQGSESLFVSGFFADALAFDVLGNLFVADVTGHKIKKVTPGGGTTDFATIGKPNGLAFDAAGNLFVSDESTGSIIKLTPTGSISPLPPGFSGLNGPFGLAFDRNGNLFVSEANTGTISEITPKGTKTVFASGLNSPEGLAFDSAGNLYEVDFGSGNVFKFTTAAGKSTFATGLLGPRHIAIDQNDNVYVSNSITEEILEFTPIGQKSTFASNVQPGGLAFEPHTAQLANISTRASVKTGAGVTIAGFIVTGTAPKQVLVRGMGPFLAQHGVSGVLADPTLDLHNSTSSIATNDDWQTAANSNQIPANLRPSDPRESAILITLQPGSYTAILAGKNGTTGIGLVEVYDLSPGAFSQLTNVSTRGFVGTGANVMIGGFITSGGNGVTQVIICGLGPSLTQYGVSGALADPTLELHDVNGTLLASNNNWRGIQQAEIQATGKAPQNDLEAALVVTLPAGQYTAIVKGNGGGTGIGLVEVFKLR